MCHPPRTRIRTRGNEYESHESPEDGHARLSISAQSEVRDMRHAIAPHFYENKSIMSHGNDGSHSNHTTTSGGERLSVSPGSRAPNMCTTIVKSGKDAKLIYTPKKGVVTHVQVANRGSATSKLLEWVPKGKD